MITRRLPSPRRADGGETLLEILIAIVISGIVMVGLVSGLTTVILASDTHRHLTDVEVVAREYGEALVNQAYHPPTAKVSSVSGTTLAVNSVQGSFPATPFFVAVDAEVLKVTAVSGNTWTVAVAPVESHAAGAQVTYDVVDDACLTPAHLQPTYAVPSGAQYIQAPTVSAPVEFFDSSGAALATGDCTSYWKTVPPCTLYSPLEHLTDCNPALMRVTISVSTGATSPSKADTTTRVLIRRGDA